MDIKDLRYVKAVIQDGSMSKAASRLFTTQSNVTQRIKKIEENLGVELFSRKPSGTYPTEHAINLIPYLDSIEQTLIDAKNSVKQRDKIKIMRIGILETIAATKLPKMLENLSALHPDLKIHITSENHDGILDQLKNKEIDLAVLIKHTEHPLIHSEIITNEELVIISKNSKTVTKLDLEEKNNIDIVVFRRGCHFRSTLEDFLLTKKNINTITCHEFTSIEAIITCVSIGIGITILPRSFIEKYISEYDLAIHELPNKISEQHLRIYHNIKTKSGIYYDSVISSFK